MRWSVPLASTTAWGWIPPSGVLRTVTLSAAELPPANDRAKAGQSNNHRMVRYSVTLRLLHVPFSVFVPGPTPAGHEPSDSRATLTPRCRVGRRVDEQDEAGGGAGFRSPSLPRLR